MQPPPQPIPQPQLPPEVFFLSSSVSLDNVVSLALTVSVEESTSCAVKEGE